MDTLATIFLALALVHTFAAPLLRRRGFHLLAEVELVFVLWGAALLVAMAGIEGPRASWNYVRSLRFSEPFFVFVVMTVAATRPVLQVAARLVTGLARYLPLAPGVALFATALVVGPLLGSVITEPAAMTITALLMKEHFFDRGLSRRGCYLTLAVLFVNVSIGGVLTTFAAPPVLMVAAAWNWTTPFMLKTFGLKAALAVVVNAVALTAVLRKELLARAAAPAVETNPVPWSLAVLLLMCLGGVVALAHEPLELLAVFLVFLVVTRLTKTHQDDLKVREGALVGGFLAGLVVLGGLQRWWLEAALGGLGEGALFVAATALTGITDNAALTYLGSLVPGLSDAAKYALVAGAVAGGGLTVVANAPNPAGFSILGGSFGDDGIQAGKLLLAAIVPTLVAMAAFWLL